MKTIKSTAAKTTVVAALAAALSLPLAVGSANAGRPITKQSIVTDDPVGDVKVVEANGLPANALQAADLSQVTYTVNRITRTVRVVYRTDDILVRNGYGQGFRTIYSNGNDVRTFYSVTGTGTVVFSDNGPAASTCDGARAVESAADNTLTQVIPFRCLDASDDGDRLASVAVVFKGSGANQTTLSVDRTATTSPLLLGPVVEPPHEN